MSLRLVGRRWFGGRGGRADVEGGNVERRGLYADLKTARSISRLEAC